MIIFPLLLLVSGCRKQQSDAGTSAVQARTSVEVTSIRHASIRDFLTLSGTSLYLKRNVITSPIPAFITDVHIRLGDRVSKGDVLYILESKERRALGAEVLNNDSTLAGFGTISIKAPYSGIISTLEKQQLGDYVLEGTQLCTLAESNNLAIQLNVPFEYAAYTTPGKPCTLRLPDGKAIAAVITTPLTTMNALSQTQSILAKPTSALFLPENLIVKVEVSKHKAVDMIVLPKACVLTDEMLSSFWVMKLINDSVAVKVPVKTGDKSDSLVQIVSPVFSAEDKILIQGNYGLPDTARVVVVKSEIRKQ